MARKNDAGTFRDINGFAKSTGAMYTMAAQTGALVVFGEHRYYGTSLPAAASVDNQAREANASSSSASAPAQVYKYLSAPQALADFAALVVHLKATLVGGAANDSAVIAVGGSYVRQY